MKDVVSSVRTNKNIWELAEWLYDNLIDPLIDSYTGSRTNWKNEGQWYKDVLYDKAVDLLQRVNPPGVFS